MFFEMSTRTRQNFIGPVERPCAKKKCDSEWVVLVDRAKQRKLYWAVPLGTTHAITAVCPRCSDERRLIGSQTELIAQAVLNAQALAALESEREREATEAKAKELSA